MIDYFECGFLNRSEYEYLYPCSKGNKLCVLGVLISVALSNQFYQNKVTELKLSMKSVKLPEFSMLSHSLNSAKTNYAADKAILFHDELSE